MQAQPSGVWREAPTLHHPLHQVVEETTSHLSGKVVVTWNRRVLGIPGRKPAALSKEDSALRHSQALLQIALWWTYGKN